jgi:hypothetical protein
VSAAAGRADPRRDLRLQNRHRYHAGIQHLIVETTDVERRAEFALGVGAKSQNGQFAYLVRQCLTRLAM